MFCMILDVGLLKNMVVLILVVWCLFVNDFLFVDFWVEIILR